VRKSRRVTTSQKKKRVPWIVLLCMIGLALVVLLFAKLVVPKERQESYPIAYTDELMAAAEEFDLDPCMVAAQVFCESSYNPEAVSAVGAIGLMQIMPETGEWLATKIDIPGGYSTERLTEPAVNLRLGCWYMSFLCKRYDGQWKEALTAYIAGQGMVDKWLSDPELSKDGKHLDLIPGQDAKEYAEKVMNTHEKYVEAYPDLFACTLPDNGVSE